MEHSKTHIKRTFYFFIIITICYVLFLYTTIIKPERSQFTYSGKVFEKHGDKKIVVGFRNDDLSINSNAKHEASVLNIFSEYGVKQTFAYIPKRGENKNRGSHSPQEEPHISEALENWFKQGRIELALHGYAHKKSEDSSGEFDGLPYNIQFEKISFGKKKLDKTLNNNVNIFAPPWNQADNNTVKACLHSGIHIFSGYLGELPAEGMTFVNTNAVLFPKANPMGEGKGLPAFEDVLAHAKKGYGTAFIIAFYHSRYDFKSSEDYSYLEKLLKNITNDPLIEISSIGKIAEKYKDLSPAYNLAGLNTKQAARSQNRAKPYILLYRKFQNIIGKDLNIDLLYNDAFREYWSGNYKHASMLTHEIIKKCDRYIVCGRIMAILSSGAVFLFFLGAVKYIRPRASFFYYRSFLWISIAPFLAVGVFLNMFRPVSAMRIEEFNIIMGLYVGGILIQYFLLKTLDIKRKTYKMFQ